MTNKEVKAEVNEWCNDSDGDIHLMGEAIKFYADGIGYDTKETIAVIDSFIGHLTAMRQKLKSNRKELLEEFWSKLEPDHSKMNDYIDRLLYILTDDQLADVNEAWFSE